MGKWVNCCLYDLKYLENEELNEDDLHNIFDTHSLTASCIVAMFRLIGDKRQQWEIMKLIRTNPKWMDKHTITRKQYNKFKQSMIKVFKNVYQYKNVAAVQRVEWWLTQYCFKVK